MRNSRYFFILLKLAELGASQRRIKITESSVASLLNISQQSVSRIFSKLTEEGLISRNPYGIMLTQKAIDYLNEIKSRLAMLEKQTSSFLLKGEVFTGFGDGKYYLSLPEYQKAVKSLTSYVPFPGTLNLKLDSESVVTYKLLKNLAPIKFPGFISNKRSFGGFSLMPCVIKNLNCHIIIPFRTHYDHTVAEIISPYWLRKMLSLQDGSKLEVEINLSSVDI